LAFLFTIDTNDARSNKYKIKFILALLVRHLGFQVFEIRILYLWRRKQNQFPTIYWSKENVTIGNVQKSVKKCYATGRNLPTSYPSNVLETKVK